MSGQRQRSMWMLVGLFVSGVLAMAVSAENGIIPVAIDVSPNVLNLASKGQVVTVHTDLPYSSVIGSSVALNGIGIDRWKSDDCGNFVAKFAMADIEGLGLKVGEYNTLTLTGYLVNEMPFAGSQDILVVDNVPAGRK